MSASPSHLTPKQPPIKVLIVDDSVVERISLGRICSSLGYVALECDGAGNVLEIIERERVDLVICDWELGSTNGLEVCSTLRAAKLDFFVYFILISSHSEERYILAALQAGTDEFIRKPINKLELQVRLLSAQRVVALQKRLYSLQEQMPRALRELSRDLRAMSVLQSALLPDRRKNVDGLSFDYFWIPKVFVSGDHLNVIQLDEQHVAFYVLDVVGHGVPAALRALALSRLLSMHPQEGVLVENLRGGFVQRVRGPSEVLGLLNERYQMQGGTEVYFCLLYGLFNLHTGEVTFSQAGSPYPIVQNADGELTRVGESSFPIGIVEQPEYKDCVVRLEPGMRFFSFTDGLTEIRDNLGSQLDHDGVLALLEKGKGCSLGQQLDLVRHGLAHWASGKSGEQIYEDDATLLALQWRSTEDSTLFEPVDDRIKHPALERRALSPGQFGLQDDSVFEFARRKENSKILLWTDSKGNAEVSGWLENWGYELHTVHSAQDCLAFIQQTYITFLLIDLGNFPADMAEFLGSARSLGVNPSLYVLILARQSNGSQLLDALSAGVDSFTQADFSARELYTRLASGLRVADTHRRVLSKNEKLNSLKQEIEDDMQRIGDMQMSNLPKRGAAYDSLKVDLFFKPAGIVSKQYMNVFELPDGHVGFFHLTAEGKGLVGATRGWAVYRQLSGAAYDKSSTLRPNLSPTSSPSGVLRELNTLVLEEKLNDLHFSLCYGVLNPKNGDARLSHAGYPLCTVTRAKGSVESLGAYGPQVGLSVDSSFQDVFFTLNPGDRLFIHPPSVADHVATDLHTSVDLGEVFKDTITLEFPALNGAFSEVFSTKPQVRDVSMLFLEFGTYEPVVTYHYLRTELQGLAQHYTELEHAEQFDFRAGFSVMVPLQISSVHDLVDAISLELKSLGVDEIVAGNIQLAVFEIATNVVRHSGMTPPDRFEVQVLTQPRSLLIAMIDKGTHIPDAMMAEAVNFDFDFDVTDESQFPEGGLGLPLVMGLSTKFKHVRIQERNHTLLWFDLLNVDSGYS